MKLTVVSKITRIIMYLFWPAGEFYPCTLIPYEKNLAGNIRERIL